MFQAPTPHFDGTLHAVPSGNAGALNTVGRMRAFVNEAKTDPRMIQAAVSVIHGTPQMNECAEASALFSFVQRNIRYVKDVLGVETLADPRLTLSRMVGDCDDKATLLATMAEAVGYPTRFVLAGYQGGEYEHVYVQLLCKTHDCPLGVWIDADTTLRQPFGYAAPFPAALWVESTQWD